MNTNILAFVIGLIIGYIIMYMTSNIFSYHGPNSNNIRKEIIYDGDIAYKFVPKILS